MGFRLLPFLGLCALILAGSRSARAEPFAAASTYDVPAGCESAEAFRARVTTAPSATSSPPPPYRVRITAHEDRFEGTVLLAGAAHSRTIEAETCEDVVKVLALAVSLSTVSVEPTPPAPPLLLTTVGPRASEDQPTPTPGPAKRRDLLVSFGASLLADSQNRSGAALDTKVIYRNELFAAGAFVELGSAVFDYNYVGVAPMAGIFAPGPTWLRAGVLGAVGLHSYWGVDGVGWFGACPCGGGSLPFTGLRGVLGVDVGYLHVGLHGFVDADLGRLQGTLLDTRTNALSPYNVGTTRFGGGLAIGPRVSL